MIDKTKNLTEDIMRPEKVKNCKLGYLYDTAYIAYQGTSFVPEKRAADFCVSYSELLDEDVEIIKEHEGDVERYKTKYLSLLTIWLNAKTKCMSSMITGPANFPVEKNRKNLNYEQTACDNFMNWREKVLKKITRPESTDIVKGSDGAIEKMYDKLASLERLQEQMRSANKVIRKKNISDEDRLSMISEVFPAYTDEQLKEVLTITHYNKKGFASFQLTNNDAKIRNLKKDIEREEKRLAAYTDGNKEREVNGITIIENVDENRLQLVFDGKPEDEVRKELKSNGYRWSGKNGCWQRQLTDNAIYNLDRLSFLK